MAVKSETPPKENGITEADIEQIEAYLRKPPHRRSVDDLCPPSDD